MIGIRLRRLPPCTGDVAWVTFDDGRVRVGKVREVVDYVALAARNTWAVIALDEDPGTIVTLGIHHFSSAQTVERSQVPGRN